MKSKQSIIGTFFINIMIVILSSLVIILALWLYRTMLYSAQEESFIGFISTIKTTELALVFLFALLTTLLVSRLLAKDLKKHFLLFTSYFHDASKNLKKIDTKALEFKEFEELAHSVNEMVDKLRFARDENIAHKSYLQAVLESQQSIVFVMRDDYIVSVNRAFLNFFEVGSIDEFYNSYENLCELFIEEDGYLRCNSDDKEWKTFILENHSLLHKVKFLKEKEVHIFIISISEVENSKQRDFVLSLTDVTKIENERKLFQEAVSTDTLTGIANRLHFNTILEQQIALSKRYQEPFSLILFDIDDFKRVNDTYGHLVGDDVLVTLAKSVSKMIRKSDTFARWGGEEFGIILPQTKEHEAYELANKIRENIESIRFGEGFKITCSFGVKEYHDSLGSSTFIQEVDILLYKAKREGKNRVVSV
jgi:diguanylate cyclase (GGDEF)-like protein